MAKENLTYFEYKEKYRIINSYKSYAQTIVKMNMSDKDKTNIFLYILLHESTNQDGDIEFKKFSDLLGDKEMAAKSFPFPKDGNNFSEKVPMDSSIYRFLAFTFHDKFFYKLGDLLEQQQALNDSKENI